MGKLERKLDMSLVRRIKARPDGSLYIPRAESNPVKKLKPPRAADDYRGARRNVDRIKGWPSATFAKSRPLAPTFAFGVALNRSRKLPRAKTYVEAREISRGVDKAA
jgi:hypothetical protein